MYCTISLSIYFISLEIMNCTAVINQKVARLLHGPVDGMFVTAAESKVATSPAEFLMM